MMDVTDVNGRGTPWQDGSGGTGDGSGDGTTRALRERPDTPGTAGRLPPAPSPAPSPLPFPGPALRTPGPERPHDEAGWFRA
ncbi:hypothetical protein ADZ36_14480 [Streptomyces fradiae]|uniref:Uncharacterized protein n=2 Tax=Streptomyces TaxID=1883 RepID=A0A3M8FDW9_9ACTN|nr:hypothetical protein ADZ36_14480 [Streptomyces fradiae]OFA59162.1 hypothetical protein BEN35_02800 [Streptomyces fradiae]PQM24883.1 hypothetical protein Sfr7A_01450 [Streptomyces xinghaiensis]RKM98935.1 hypothetical protein SFRA_001450 [Streptomyces xinghaiensis]RNC76163.1 hypothetical protein DC095_002925 [Streptomyces xinghaiensis]